MQYCPVLMLLSVLIISADTMSGQLSQWRRPLRNAIYPDEGLLKEWPAKGPILL